jgi:hypothetical protein
MNRACFFQNTTEHASSTQLNLHEQIQYASCIRPMKNNFVRMKKVFIFFFSFVLLLMFAGMDKVVAQTSVTVIQGSTHTYSVTPVPDGSNYQYHWSISGGSSSIPGTNSTTNNIVWDGVTGSYILTVYAVNPVTGCAGNNKTLTINVVGVGITITGPAAACPKTDNQSGDFILTVNFTGTGAWSFTINDGASDKTYSVADGTSSYQITVPGYTNASSTATIDHTFRITSVTTTGGTVSYDGSETNAAQHNATVTIQPTPATSGIIQN